jgi:hypothetical protein
VLITIRQLWLRSETDGKHLTFTWSTALIARHGRTGIKARTATADSAKPIWTTKTRSQWKITGANQIIRAMKLRGERRRVSRPKERGKVSEFDRLKAQKEAIIAREKSEVAIAVGLTIYARMVRLAHDSGQVVGEKSDYYVTLEQLETAFVSLRDELRREARHGNSER